MPTNRRRSQRAVVHREIAPAVLYVLRYGELPARGSDDAGGLLEALVKMHRPALRADWFAARDEVLAGWVAEWPGTRPNAWWLFDAPEPRAQIGGAAGAIGPGAALVFGLPKYWALHWSPDDPPEFESEPTYLRRLGLLTAGEARRLTESDYEPVTFTLEDER